MKKITVALLSVLLLITVSACNSDNDREHINEKESVAYLMTKKSFCSADGRVVLYNVFEYDKNNNLIRDSSYNGEGELKSYQRKEYDERNNLIKDSSYNKTNELGWYEDYEYDENNNIILNRYFNKEGTMLNKTKTNYDQQNRIIESIIYNDNEQRVVKYLYDSNGYTVNYGNGIKISSTDVITLNENGDIVKKISSYTDGSSETVINNEYDEDGFLVKASSTLGGTDMGYVLIINDEKGNKLKESAYYSNGNCRSYGVYTYDNEGNLIKADFYDETDTLVNCYIY